MTVTVDMSGLVQRGMKFAALMALADDAGVTLPLSPCLERDPVLWEASWWVPADEYTEWLCWLRPDSERVEPGARYFIHDAHLDRVDRLRVAVFTAVST